MAAPWPYRVERVYDPMSTSSDMSPDDTEFAGEYVLRVLSEDAHRAAAVRASTDPAFAAEIRAWEDHLASLTDEIVPIAPSAAAKSALMGRLFGMDKKRGVFERLGLWKGLTGGLAAAVAVLAVLAFVPELIVPKAPRFVTELAAEADSLRILAVYDAGADIVQITRTAGGAAEGRSLQLWCIVEGKAPWSVGVLSDTANQSLSLPVEWIEGADSWSLAVSDEPLGGSPTGQPTGAVLAAAPMTLL